MSVLSAVPVDTTPDVQRTPAELAYRRAWWSLLLYPVAVVVSLVVGGSLFWLLDDNVGDPAIWVFLVAVIPALLVVMIPGMMAVTHGRKAIKLGRLDGRVPAVVGVALGFLFVALDLSAFIFG
jgi:flagellar biosynthesis protein FliQ